MIPGLTKYVVLGSTLVIGLLGVALYFTGKWALNERDGRILAEYNIKLDQATDKLKEEHQTKAGDIRSEFTGRIETLEKDLNHERSKYTKLAATASIDALEKPISFGDDVLRDLMRIDCLWSSGRKAADPGVRSACRREAALADPAASGLLFTVANPELIRRWGDACTEYKTFGGGEDWRDSHPGITERMCFETVVMMTPETSAFMREWVNNGEAWTVGLVNHAEELEELLDAVLSKPQKSAPPSN